MEDNKKKEDAKKSKWKTTRKVKMEENKNIQNGRRQNKRQPKNEGTTKIKKKKFNTI